MEDQDSTESLAPGPEAESGDGKPSPYNRTEQSENVYENKGRGQEVKELRSRRVEESKTWTRPRVSPLGPQAEGGDGKPSPHNRTEQSENVYENKGRGQEVKELRSRRVEESKTWTRPRVSPLGPQAEGGDGKPSPHNRTEQSENVYENKGRGQEVKELRSRRVEESKTWTRPRVSPLGPQAEGGDGKPSPHNRTEQSENVYENKGSVLEEK